MQIAADLPTQQQASKVPSRGFYGELAAPPNCAHALLEQAIKKGRLTKPFAKFDKKCCGHALNYDFYDCTPNGAAVIVQQRWTQVTKYGSSSKKNYYLLRRIGRGMAVESYDQHKPRIIKLSKVSAAPGDVIDTLSGKARTPLKAKTCTSAKWCAFKIVESRDGSFWSVYDESFEWRLNRCHVEAATDNHRGGYYCYATADEALQGLQRGAVFVTDWQEGKTLALLECDAAGQIFKHENGKLCVSKLTPRRVVEILGQG